MSILIKGVDIPTKGFRIIVVNADGTAHTADGVTTAIPVPPHGRLGDIDKLAKRIEYERYHHEHTDGLAAQHHVAEYLHFLKVIDDTPAIIPEDK